MTDLEDERHRGARANAIMSDPLMIESFKTLKDNYFDAWANSLPPTQQRESIVGICTTPSKN